MLIALQTSGPARLPPVKSKADLIFQRSGMGNLGVCLSQHKTASARNIVRLVAAGRVIEHDESQ